MGLGLTYQASYNNDHHHMELDQMYLQDSSGPLCREYSSQLVMLELWLCRFQLHTLLGEAKWSFVDSSDQAHMDTCYQQ